MKGIKIAFETISSFDYFYSFVYIGYGRYLGVKPEPVKELRSEFAFFGIAGTHENESSRMCNRYAFTFDGVCCACCCIEQEIDQMIFEQVDFIDIKKTAIGAGQQSRLGSLDP